MKDVLEVEGYTTTITHDGQTALALCREKLFDLALIDIKLPDMSGVNLIDKLDEVSDATAYIITTGNASMDTAIEAVRQRNIVAYETKPLNMDHVLPLIRQVVKRRQVEEELRTLEKDYQEIFNSANDAIFIHDIETGAILDVNRSACVLHKCTKEELLSTPLEELSIGEPPYSQEEVAQWVQRAAKEGPQLFEWLGKKKDGGFMWEEISLKTTTIRGKERVIAVVRDITERKEMEEQLVVTDRLASIGELASGIAHELNNSLTSIIGFSDLLLGKDMPDDGKEDLGVINREAKRTAGAVSKLLTFARKHQVGKQPVDINGALKTVLALRTYEQKVSNIEVNTCLASDLPEVTADGFQLQQVFLNLIINAEYFMIETHGRGTLTITTERVGDIIRASFADDGPGITEENLGHLFDLFFTTKEVGQGTGLGLSICHGIITKHGGRIYAESEVGKGATFIVELPIS